MDSDIVANILLVDDLRENLVALEALIRQPGRACFTARSGEEALGLMLDRDFALAIVDVQMPSMNGFELAALMRGTERTRHIPIVFVTAAGRELDYAFRGYESGAVDFLHKPLDPHAVRSKVNVFVDLHRQRLALQRAQAELERAVRMRDDFMSIVSHELRTPLNTLHLQVQLRRRLLAADPASIDVEALRKMTERDERQVRSMVRLIDDMLDVSRLRTGRLAIEPADTDLAELVRRVAESFAEQARGAGSTLGVHAPGQLAARCDGFRIEQVVTNLVTNALRYGKGSPIQMTLRPDGARALISVKDRGIGIALQDQQRIFEQFERTESAQSVAGLGLGLYITRQIVRAHGGEIRVQSEPGQGSEFIVALPLAGPPEDAGGAAA
jgi:signal transduction histidine kinase